MRIAAKLRTMVANMHKLNQKGIINPLLIPLILAVIVLLVGSGLSVYYYSKYVEQRDNNQPFIDAAVVVAEEKLQEKLQTEFTEREKQPNKIYTSPSEFGSVRLQFPKTWSSYVEAEGASLEYYGHPNFVPSQGVNYALRMSVVTKQFANEVKSYDNEVKKGDLRASAIQVSGTTGTRLDGMLKKDQQGVMVIFPLRDKTLKVWTENNDFKGDFDNIVLKGLTFIP